MDAELYEAKYLHRKGHLEQEDGLIMNYKDSSCSICFPITERLTEQESNFLRWAGVRYGWGYFSTWAVFYFRELIRTEPDTEDWVYAIFNLHESLPAPKKESVQMFSRAFTEAWDIRKFVTPPPTPSPFTTSLGSSNPATPKVSPNRTNTPDFQRRFKKFLDDISRSKSIDEAMESLRISVAETRNDEQGSHSEPFLAKSEVQTKWKSSPPIQYPIQEILSVNPTYPNRFEPTKLPVFDTSSLKVTNESTRFTTEEKQKWKRNSQDSSHEDMTRIPASRLQTPQPVIYPPYNPIPTYNLMEFSPNQQEPVTWVHPPHNRPTYNSHTSPYQQVPASPFMYQPYEIPCHPVPQQFNNVPQPFTNAAPNYFTTNNAAPMPGVTQWATPSHFVSQPGYMFHNPGWNAAPPSNTGTNNQFMYVPPQSPQVAQNPLVTAPGYGNSGTRYHNGDNIYEQPPDVPINTRPVLPPSPVRPLGEPYEDNYNRKNNGYMQNSANDLGEDNVSEISISNNRIRRPRTPPRGPPSSNGNSSSSSSEHSSSDSDTSPDDGSSNNSDSEETRKRHKKTRMPRIPTFSNLPSYDGSASKLDIWIAQVEQALIAAGWPLRGGYYTGSEKMGYKLCKPQKTNAISVYPNMARVMSALCLKFSGTAQNWYAQLLTQDKVRPNCWKPAKNGYKPTNVKENALRPLLEKQFGGRRDLEEALMELDKARWDRRTPLSEWRTKLSTLLYRTKLGNNWPLRRQKVLATLPEEYRIRIGMPENEDELWSKATEYQVTLEDVKSTKTRTTNANNACRTCGGQGHWSKECPNKRKNLVNTVGTSLIRSYPSKPNVISAESENRSCYNCGKKGHLSRDCRSKPRCSRCKKEGHRAMECKEQKTVNSVKTHEEEPKN